ncbi:5-methyltetrahydropteroyltriglutamate--homocysteine S-methyltransferase, partial [Brevibacillus sp. SIMBA_076]
ILLVKGNNQGFEAIAEKVDANKFTVQTLASSNARNHGNVQSNVEKVKTRNVGRQLPFKERYQKQQEFFKLPFLPSTTIGSFPQTFEVK